jgi:hypothetical protein
MVKFACIQNVIEKMGHSDKLLDHLNKCYSLPQRVRDELNRKQPAGKTVERENKIG